MLERQPGVPLKAGRQLRAGGMQQDVLRCQLARLCHVGGSSAWSCCFYYLLYHLQWAGN